MTRTYAITGTSRGIGLEITRQLLAAGNNVFALARHPENSKMLVDLKEKYPDKLSLFSVDVNSDEQIEAFSKQLSPNVAIDVLINNAGIYGGHQTLEKLSLNDVIKTIETNSVAPIRVTRTFLPYLKKSKTPKVIFITSLMGSVGDNESGGSYGYRMSKAALNMFQKSFSIDFPSITSLVIHPGWVKTDMGGDEAPVTPEQSARGILKIVDKATQQDSGKFLDFEGDVLPW